MAGLLYLPRLFVYHADAEKGSELSETLKIMERKLLRYIMNPAMIATWIFGGWILIEYEIYRQPWMHAKLTLVVLMTGAHHMLSAQRKSFMRDENTKSAKYYRYINEVPTILMLGIVFLAVLKPF
ncbi:MAG: protoporphyrinogen oxidase HemJ [Rickettsiales bacterium]|nr:protoporphyrinogen oxidase HemJ [Rickettsiales bacterium]